MSYDLVISNATVIGPDGTRVSNIAVSGETIAVVGPGLAS